MMLWTTRWKQRDLVHSAVPTLHLRCHGCGRGAGTRTGAGIKTKAVSSKDAHHLRLIALFALLDCVVNLDFMFLDQRLYVCHVQLARTLMCVYTHTRRGCACTEEDARASQLTYRLTEHARNTYTHIGIHSSIALSSVFVRSMFVVYVMPTSNVVVVVDGGKEERERGRLFHSA